MEKSEILNKIEQILPELQQWITYKEASFEPEKLQILKEVAAALQPGQVINWSCSSCSAQTLTIIWSWYQREHQG